MLGEARQAPQHIAKMPDLNADFPLKIDTLKRAVHVLPFS
jgi:hypothetical protein